MDDGFGQSIRTFEKPEGCSEFFHLCHGSCCTDRRGGNGLLEWK